MPSFRPNSCRVGLLVTALLFTSAVLRGQTVSEVADRPASLYPPRLEMVAAYGTEPLPTIVAAPRMAPELALQTYEERQQRQAGALPAYSADEKIYAELPDTSQRGEFHLKRQFIAPRTLLFKPVKFVGDSFVKSNVIARLLQSEVDHVHKGDGGQTAINSSNYKFSYKGTEEVDGRPVYVYHVKPRKKRAGLFKGRLYVDAASGAVRRVEGSFVKSPSFFIKKVEFQQDYTEVEGYMLPAHMHSVAKTRIVGRAVVDITTSDYALADPEMQKATTPATPDTAQASASQ
jgi:hypothetical protein